MIHKVFLIALLIYSCVAFTAGVFHVAGNDFSGIAWPFAPIGMFIWTDALTIGFFLIIACVVLLIRNNAVWTGLFFSCFITVRSFVEILYALQAQFSTSVRPWEVNWQNFLVVQQIGIPHVFVISQLLFTFSTIAGVLLFAYFLKRYFQAQPKD